MEHTACKAKWDTYSCEWPPQMAICVGCGVIFKLIGHDPESDKLSFRRLN